MKMTLKLTALCLLAGLPALAADYRLTTLETAQGMFQSATNSAMYAAAAQQFEFLVEEEGVRNGRLFYTLGNSWFMANDLGRAILNYRRAEHYLPGNADVQHNLASALALRTDLIPKQEPSPLAAKLLGWHLNSSTTLRWWLFAFCWLLFWSACFWTSRTPKKEARITAAATGVLSAILLASLLADAIMARRAHPGVIVAREVLARKGDGTMYAPAFLEPLHSGTEFRLLEERTDWWHVRLADGQSCWIPAGAAETVKLD
ncbi:hypothetical protein [Pontiella sp.]|uniref:hypothetical protein n=1 Tax=Pontiella sp. TaxID=2837462 RepID=UPI003564C6A8